MAYSISRQRADPLATCRGQRRVETALARLNSPEASFIGPKEVLHSATVRNMPNLGSDLLRPCGSRLKPAAPLSEPASGLDVSGRHSYKEATLPNDIIHMQH